MRGGLFLGYWPWFSPEEQTALAVLGDELGLDSVWISEAWGQDAVSLLGYLAARTERIALGSGLMQIPARKPTATAMAAVTLDVLSGGRFRLGLGLSGPQVSEGWYGVPFTKPLGRTREYVQVVRDALARKPIALPLPDDEPNLGLGKPLKLLAKPVSQPIPIYLGSIGPKAVRQTGEIADGWLPFLLDPKHPDVLLDPLRAGLASSPDPDRPFDVCPVVPMAVGDDVAAARDAVRPWLAFYLGAMGAKQKNFYVELAEHYGHGDSAREVQDRALAGDQAGALAAVSDEIVDASCIACAPDALGRRLAEYEAIGATSIAIVPAGDREGTVRAFARAIGG